jgi:AraC family transcriptional regulator of adaptative response/methylated-DNA-[protein]-cysteine methyltransferase
MNTISSLILTDADRWQAIVARDAAADGAFYYAVRTTGIYCRNVCAARLPNRENVSFHATCDDAERAGFRPCRRCRPSGVASSQLQAQAIDAACRRIEAAQSEFSLKELAGAANISPHHFHRLFKRRVGLSPKAYAAALRQRRLKNELHDRQTVTEAMHAAGFSSSSRLYEAAAGALGMSPHQYKNRGRGAIVRYAVGQCWLGAILVAATERGVCAILLGDEADDLVHELRDRFSRAELTPGDDSFQAWLNAAIELVGDPRSSFDLPLDIGGTVFEQRVWQVLREIPCGSTASYSEIAESIGQPTAARAVAKACAANPLAVAVPCHRAVRSDGSLAGYRWGVDRKVKLLERERGAGS